MMKFLLGEWGRLLLFLICCSSSIACPLYRAATRRGCGTLRCPVYRATNIRGGGPLGGVRDSLKAFTDGFGDGLREVTGGEEGEGGGAGQEEAKEEEEKGAWKGKHSKEEMEVLAEEFLTYIESKLKEQQEMWPDRLPGQFGAPIMGTVPMPAPEGAIAEQFPVPQNQGQGRPLGLMTEFIVQLLPRVIMAEAAALLAGKLIRAIEAQLSMRSYHPSGKTVLFGDVIGCDEAKEEVAQIVDFLRSPGRYAELGASVPKGVLLVGPPGTGKTMIGKACAGEAGVPFLYISGSDFNGVYAGTGVAKVKKLFAMARRHKRAIIFLDEIDYVGKKRGDGMGQSLVLDRESTLNQLLCEMDGFDTRAGDQIVVMATTNRKVWIQIVCIPGYSGSPPIHSLDSPTHLLTHKLARSALSLTST
ncbi:unnamed protein product [Chrysoparadoxa australica]